MIEAILYYLIALDMLSYNLMCWFGGKWYNKKFSVLARYFPAKKGFGAYYLILILWLGYSLWRMNVLPF
ncbi:hypothetical protein HOD05_02890 [Candidatus Woesearchaeota archaeon]|jgi:hypothetical protein|nr:hypothetical protein [Candidatus Woesearchaeota archaeon]MBT4151319.1 hypothetical protein [Candidatus Woesearchaeota archaeon]MBT4247444.1 hypothetical protein [Candidatus Woesearchaeota archaeon]MBT4434141.1 hypothetical protein [Candidatus Woesearchaeota archaeon]MBT5215923.1 hypothetical protein [Candidatus Woesearchaeota archaeon]